MYVYNYNIYMLTIGYIYNFVLFCCFRQ